jgi:hypothetical protein
MTIPDIQDCRVYAYSDRILLLFLSFSRSSSTNKSADIVNGLDTIDINTDIQIEPTILKQKENHSRSHGRKR